MFQSAFKRLTKQVETPTTNASAEITPSTSPKPEETKPLTPEIPPQTPPQPQPTISDPSIPDVPQPQPTVSDPSIPDVPLEASNNANESTASLVQDSREVYAPFNKDDEELKLSIEHQPSESETPASTTAENSPSAERTERSSESTVVDPNDLGLEQDHGLDMAPQQAEIFDTTTRGVMKSDLWQLATEMEAMHKEKLGLQGKIDGMLKQVAQAEHREKRVKEGADRSLKKMAELETLLNEEKKNVVKAEAEGRSQLVSLENRLQDELERSKCRERELKDATLVHELAKAESRKGLETALDRLASSEKKAQELALEVHLRAGQVGTLEEALRMERGKARELEGTLRSQIVAAHARVEESSRLLKSSSANVEKLGKEVTEAQRAKEDYASRYDEAARQNAKLEEKVKELELRATQLAEERDQKEKEKQNILSTVLKPLQAAFGDLRSTVDTLRLDNKDMTSKLEANAAAERARIEEEQKMWKRRGGVLVLTMGAAIVIMAVSSRQPFNGVSAAGPPKMTYNPFI